MLSYKEIRLMSHFKTSQLETRISVQLNHRATADRIWQQRQNQPSKSALASQKDKLEFSKTHCLKKYKVGLQVVCHLDHYEPKSKNGKLDNGAAIS